MADANDIILKHLEHQWAQARQSETQRASITQFTLALAAATQGLIVQFLFSPSSITLAAMLIFLGVFGALVSAKYYERFRLHMCRVGRLMEWLEKHHPNATLTELEGIADKKHAERHPTMHKFRLNSFWQVLHWTIALGGLANAAAIVAKNGF